MATFDITSLSISSFLRCSEELKTAGVAATSMEELATVTVRYLYDALVDADGQRAAVLVRYFTTLPYAGLSTLLRAGVRVQLGLKQPDPQLRCLTLLGTAGDQPAWNNRHASVGHAVIPLLSSELVAQSPMIAQLLQQFGIDVGAFKLLTPSYS